MKDKRKWSPEAFSQMRRRLKKTRGKTTKASRQTKSKTKSETKSKTKAKAKTKPKTDLSEKRPRRTRHKRAHASSKNCAVNEDCDEGVIVRKEGVLHQKHGKKWVPI